MSDEKIEIIHNTGSFLTADNIDRLKRLFSTPEDYAKNLRALWLFRDVLYMSLFNDPDPESNKLFALWDTINNVIDSLLRQDVLFDGNGRAYYHKNGKVVYL